MIAILLLSVVSADPPPVQSAGAIMLASNNKLGVTRKESPALTAAAQTHADYLATHHYSRAALAAAPQGVTGHEWGNGTSQSRAAAHGFRGSLSAPNPLNPRFPILGETLSIRTNYDPAGVVASWNRRWPGDMHWIPLVSPTYDVAGFGYAVNPLGEHIFVGMYGKSGD